MNINESIKKYLTDDSFSTCKHNGLNSKYNSNGYVDMLISTHNWKTQFQQIVKYIKLQVTKSDNYYYLINPIVCVLSE